MHACEVWLISTGVPHPRDAKALADVVQFPSLQAALESRELAEAPVDACVLRASDRALLATRVRGGVMLHTPALEQARRRLPPRRSAEECSPWQ